MDGMPLERTPRRVPLPLSNTQGHSEKTASVNHEVNQTLNPAGTLTLDSAGSTIVGTTFQGLGAAQPVAFC